MRLPDIECNTIVSIRWLSATLFQVPITFIQGKIIRYFAGGGGGGAMENL